MAPRTRASGATAPADVAANPMASPADGKRVREENLSTEPTCKAPRLGDAGTSDESCGPSSESCEPSSESNVKGLLAQLKASISALKAVDPQQFDEEELELAREAQGELEKVIRATDAQLEAIRNPPPEETPMAFDDLVLALGFVPTRDLAAAAQTSRHFRNAVKTEVWNRLDNLSGSFSHFDKKFRDIVGVPFLARMEREYERVPQIIATIGPNLSDRDFTKAATELSEMHTEIVYLHNELLWEKLNGRLSARPDTSGSDSEEEDDDEEETRRRDRLFKLLSDAKIPEDELAEHADMVVAELEENRHRGRYQTVGIYQTDLMSQMPPSVIEQHIPLLIKVMTEDDDFAYQVLHAIGKLPNDTLKSLNLPDTIKPPERENVYAKYLYEELMRRIYPGFVYLKK